MLSYRLSCFDTACILIALLMLMQNVIPKVLVTVNSIVII